MRVGELIKELKKYDEGLRVDVCGSVLSTFDMRVVDFSVEVYDGIPTIDVSIVNSEDETGAGS